MSSGASATGTVNIVSRSGSNQFHGNAYGYFRDSSFAAFPALNRLVGDTSLPSDLQVAEVPFDRQQLGGTIGGPIVRDKAFFFFNFENNNQDGVALRNIPSTLPGFSGFTGSPFDERLLTAKVDFIVNNSNNLIFRYSRNTNEQQQPFPTGIVPRDSTSGIFQSNDQLNANRSDGFLAGLTSALRSNLTNDFRFNFNDFENVIDPVTPDFPELRVIEQGQNFRSGTNRITPQGTTQKRYQFKDDLTYVRGNHTFRFGANNEYTKIGGLIQFFVPGIIRIFGPTARGLAAYRTEDDFLNAPVRDLFVGVGDFTLPFNEDSSTTNNNRFQAYFNDNWKIRPNFTFNYGLQYRIDSNLYNHDLERPAIIAPLFTNGTAAPGRDGNNFAPRTGFAYDIGGRGTTVIRGGVGLYYDTVIDNLRLFERADLGPPGAGQFLSQFDVRSPLLPGGDGFFGSTPPAPGSTNFITLRDLLRILPNVRADIEQRQATGCTLQVALLCPGAAISGPIFSNTFQVPYSIQYSIGVQRELPGNMLLQADFNYRKGVHEVFSYDANFSSALDRNGNSLRVLDDYEGGVPYADSSGFSAYKALLVRVDRRFSQGFQFTGSYALSRLETFGGEGLGLGAAIFNPFDFKAQDFGPGALDRKHRLVLSGIYQLPFFRNSDNAFKRTVLGGFTVSFISTAFSGLPLSAELPDGVDLFGAGTFATFLPGTRFGSVGRDVKNVGDLNALIRSYNSSIPTLAARTCTEPGTGRMFPCDPQGTELRSLAELPAGTQIGGDSLISQDVRVSKAFRFGEVTRLELIGEVFNLFNVANLSGISDIILPAADDVDPSDPSTFTIFRPTQRTSNIFGTGGPRSFQFAVKFTF